MLRFYNGLQIAGELLSHRVPLWRTSHWSDLNCWATMVTCDC